MTVLITGSNNRVNTKVSIQYAEMTVMVIAVKEAQGSIRYLYPLSHLSFKKKITLSFKSLPAHFSSADISKIQPVNLSLSLKSVLGVIGPERPQSVKTRGAGLHPHGCCLW